MKLNLPCRLMMAVAFMIVAAVSMLNATVPSDTLLMRRQWGCATVTCCPDVGERI